MDQIKRLEKIGEREKKKKKSMKNNGKVRYSLVPPRVVSIGNCRSRNANFTRARVKLPSTHYAHEIAVVFIAARRFVSARCQMKNNFATLQTFYVPVNTHPFHDSARFLFFFFLYENNSFLLPVFSRLRFHPTAVNNANAVTAGHDTNNPGNK